MVDGTRSEEGRWIWFGGAWRQVSDDGRFWWDGQQWRPLLPASRAGRGTGAWVLMVIGAVLGGIGVVRASGEVLAGFVFGDIAYSMGRATGTALILIVPGVLLLRRGWTGRWF